MRTLAVASGHAARADAREQESVALSRASDNSTSSGRIALSTRERRSLELLGDDLRETIDDAVSTAAALGGNEREAARLEVIAKDIACERARQLEYSRRLDELLCARDLEAAIVFDRLLNSANRRICALLSEHRASCSTGSRAAVVVAHANNVRVQAGR